jgi:hypothetical protein
MSVDELEEENRRLRVQLATVMADRGLIRSERDLAHSRLKEFEDYPQVKESRDFLLAECQKKNLEIQQLKDKLAKLSAPRKRPNVVADDE